MKTLNVLLTAGLLAGSFNAMCVAQDNDAESPAKAVVFEGLQIVVDDEKSDDEKSDDENFVVTEVRLDDEFVNVAKDNAAGTYSIQIESSAHADSEDGAEPQIKVGGKVVVIGPDGEKKVYDISGKDGQAFKIHLDGDGKQVLDLESLHDVLIMKNHGDDAVEGAQSVDVPEEERYMIGVQCEEAGEVLRGHLHLGDAGVVVMEVRDETPAAEAGLLKNDIIVQIDDKDLASRDDLISAVAGSDGKVLTLAVIRDGEKHSITIQPKMMKVPVIVTPALVEGFDIGELNLNNLRHLQDLDSLPEDVRKQLMDQKGNVRIRRIHPGVMIDGEAPHDEASINKLIERIRKSAGEEAAKALAEARQAQEHARDARVDAHRNTEDLGDSLRSLQKQMEAMRQQMEALQEQLETTKDDRK